MAMIFLRFVYYRFIRKWYLGDYRTFRVQHVEIKRLASGKGSRTRLPIRGSKKGGVVNFLTLIIGAVLGYLFCYICWDAKMGRWNHENGHTWDSRPWRPRPYIETATNPTPAPPAIDTSNYEGPILVTAVLGADSDTVTQHGAPPVDAAPHDFGAMVDRATVKRLP